MTRRSLSVQACTAYVDVTHPDEPVPEKTSKTLARHARYSLATYARPSLLFERGRGLKLYDQQGREYLDMSAGIAVNALGHSDDGVAEILADQARPRSLSLADRAVQATDPRLESLS